MSRVSPVLISQAALQPERAHRYIPHPHPPLCLEMDARSTVKSMRQATTAYAPPPTPPCCWSIFSSINSSTLVRTITNNGSGTTLALTVHSGPRSALPLCQMPVRGLGNNTPDRCRHTFNKKHTIGTRHNTLDVDRRTDLSSCECVDGPYIFCFLFRCAC